MIELLPDLERWAGAGRSAVLARVVDIEGSGPREPGAAMAVNDRSEVVGSVSGGCVEGAVVAEALEILDQGGQRLVTFGYSDDEAVAVGLTCGGTVHLFLESVDLDQLRPIETAVEAGRPVVLATVIAGAHAGSKLVVSEASVSGALGDADLDRVVTRDALGELSSGRTSVRHYGPRGEARQDDLSVFIETFAPAPKMLIFGAVDFTAALVRVAKVLGYHVTVCDAREPFATRQRFPLADDVIVDWPDRLLDRLGPSLGTGDAICILTHDHKFDVPAILAAASTDVGYVGAMGSRRTTAERAERLAAEGMTTDEIQAVMAPIGLDIGARTPEETAISICAEIIAARVGRPPASLRDTGGPIHHGDDES